MTRELEGLTEFIRTEFQPQDILSCYIECTGYYAAPQMKMQGIRKRARVLESCGSESEKISAKI